LQYANEAEILSGVEQPLHYFRTVITPHKLQLSEDYLRTANLGSDFILILKTGKSLISFGSQSVKQALKRRVYAEQIRHRVDYPMNSTNPQAVFVRRKPFAG
jgi:hypothetical protein